MGRLLRGNGQNRGEGVSWSLKRERRGPNGNVLSSVCGEHPRGEVRGTNIYVDRNDLHVALHNGRCRRDVYTGTSKRRSCIGAAGFKEIFEKSCFKATNTWVSQKAAQGLQHKDFSGRLPYSSNRQHCLRISKDHLAMLNFINHHRRRLPSCRHHPETPAFSYHLQTVPLLYRPQHLCVAS